MVRPVWHCRSGAGSGSPSVVVAVVVMTVVAMAVVAMTASGARCRSGQNALNRTPPRRADRIEARRFDRNPWRWARGSSPWWRFADHWQCSVCDDGADLWCPDHRRRARARVFAGATPPGDSSNSGCRRGIRGARSVQTGSTFSLAGAATAVSSRLSTPWWLRSRG